MKTLLAVVALLGLGWAALPPQSHGSDRQAQARRTAALFLAVVHNVWPPRSRPHALLPLPTGWTRRVGTRHVYVDAPLPGNTVLRLAPLLAPLVSAGRVRGRILVSFLCGPLLRKLPLRLPDRSTLVVLPPWRHVPLPVGCTISSEAREPR